MTDETGPSGGTIFDRYFPAISGALMVIYLTLATPTFLEWGFYGVLAFVICGLIIALSFGMQLEAMWKYPERYPEVMQYVR